VLQSFDVFSVKNYKKVNFNFFKSCAQKACVETLRKMRKTTINSIWKAIPNAGCQILNAQKLVAPGAFGVFMQNQTNFVTTIFN
jgi:hypothetical protein